MLAHRPHFGRGLVATCALLMALGAGAVAWQSRLTAQDQPPVHDPVAQEHAHSLSRAFRVAANAITPSVVTIETTSKPQVMRRGGDMRPGRNPFEGSPFEEFFGEEFGRQFEQRERGMPERQGTGSGVIIDRGGIVLTNNHVVEGADEVIVRLADGREFKGIDIKTDPMTDLAVLRLDGQGPFPAARMGVSEGLEIGDWVIAVGNPFGLDSTVSAGIISGKGRELNMGMRTQYLQTDAAINPGNSGGPLVNLDGEVVGINTAIASNSGGYQGVGFAIPIDVAKWVSGQLMAKGKVQRAYLGIYMQDVDRELADRVGMPAAGGVLVQEVIPDAPADKAGVHEGDVITKFAGHVVRSRPELTELVDRSQVESKQPLEIIRDGKPMTLSVTIQARPDELQLASNVIETPKTSIKAEFGELGIEVGALTPDVAKQFGYEKHQGVVITDVAQGSMAEEAGLHTGMLILKVGGTPVTSVAEFRAAVAKETGNDGVLLLVRSNGGNQFVVLKAK